MTPMMKRLCEAAVAAEQDQWTSPAKEWDEEAFKVHGIAAIVTAVLTEMKTALAEAAGPDLSNLQENQIVRYTTMAIDRILD